MADEKNVTLEQFKGFMTKADERLDKLEVGKENKVSPVSITIPTEGWASEEIGETDEEGTEASYPFYYDIAAADVTAKHRADVTISRESLNAATVCGLCPTSETTEGKIRLRAMKAPTEAITLWALASTYLGSGSRYKEIMRLNGLTSEIIHVGQVLKMPAK